MTLRQALRRPYPGSLLAATVHLVYGLLVGSVLSFPILIGLVVTVSTLPSIVGPVLCAYLLVWLLAGTNALERGRFGVLLDVSIPKPTVVPLRGPRSLWIRVSDSTFWRGIAYHLLRIPASALSVAIVFGAWGLGLALVSLPAYFYALPNGLFGLGWGGWTVALFVLAGIAVLFLVPPLTRAITWLDIRMTTALLGAGDQQELQARVRRLEETRAGAVQSADQERHRIERDLHDGAQQRLVSLAMTLGAARHRLPADDASAELVAEAHEEVKAALTELRALVRGFAPPVLTDRGLDAALSGLAARSPVPVDLRVENGTRADSTVEAVAYFVVSEALTNVAKHAQANRVLVSVSREDTRPDGGLLRIVVEDDGRGGADPDGGTGLLGLTARVAAVDGDLSLVSPQGGPTRIVVELPCAS